MFTRILVPLDGSAISEQALPAAAEIANRFSAAVVLVRVVNPEIDTPVSQGLATHLPSDFLGPTPYYQSAATTPYAHSKEIVEAEGYLRSQNTAWFGPQAQTTLRVMAGAPPQVILEAAQNESADLIVMSTHGRSGLNRLLYGSVAEAVLRGTRIPVLLVPVKN